MPLYTVVASFLPPCVQKIAKFLNKDSETLSLIMSAIRGLHHKIINLFQKLQNFSRLSSLVSRLFTIFALTKLEL